MSGSAPEVARSASASIMPKENDKPAVAAVPVPALAPLHAGWPPSAQWAVAILMAAVLVLLACHVFSGTWSGTRASDHERAGPLNPMDLNRAHAGELAQLPGVGGHLAERIVSQRDSQGRFRTIDDLRKVPGVGPKTWERIRPWVFVDAGSDQHVSSTSPTLPTQPPKTVAARTKTSKSKKEASLTGPPIDLNEASATELQRLPRIGPKLSQRIIAERSKSRFRKLEDLRRVKGIGPKTLERLRPYVTVDPTSTEIGTTDGATR